MSFFATKLYIFILLSQICDKFLHVILHVLYMYVLYDWYIERVHGMVDMHSHPGSELESKLIISLILQGYCRCR